MKKTFKSPKRNLSIRDHINSTPILNNLNTSQNMLMKVSSSWHKWLSKHIISNINCSLSHYHNGQLTILCSNATTASSIKHKQFSLIEFLHQEKHLDIKSIKVIIDNSVTHSPSENCVPQHSTLLRKNKLSDNAFQSIKHCQKITQSDVLLESLKNLEKTLKNNS